MHAFNLTKAMTFKVFVLLACLTGLAAAAARGPAQPPSHQLWDRLLGQHVHPDGKVDYAAWQADSTALNAYLAQLRAHPPAPSWSEAEQLAYWLNAYNAFTVQLVLRHYPLSSIKNVPTGKAASPWDIPFVQISDQYYTLNEIENEVIRPQFQEPRIHFALVCAARSCPILWPEAYAAPRLEAQLDRAARQFVNDPVRNGLTRQPPQFSALFEWYAPDFTRTTTLIGYLDQYATQPLPPHTQLRYLAYDWRLNDR